MIACFPLAARRGHVIGNSPDKSIVDGKQAGAYCAYMRALCALRVAMHIYEAHAFSQLTVNAQQEGRMINRLVTLGVDFLIISADQGASCLPTSLKEGACHIDYR